MTYQSFRANMIRCGVLTLLALSFVGAAQPARAFSNFGYTPTPATPSTPTGPGVVTHASAGAWRLNWGSGGSHATRYELWERVSGGSWGRIYSGSSRSFYRSGRTAPGNYFYRVRACNRIGWCSSYSGIKTVRYVKPSGLATVTAPGTNYSGSFTISWPLQSAVTGVPRLEMAKPGAGWVHVENANTSSSYRVRADKNGRYGFRIRTLAIRKCWWHWCFNLPEKIGPTRYTQVLLKPGSSPSPTIISKTSLSDRTYTVQWSPAAGEVSRYHLQRRHKAIGSGHYGGWSTVYVGASRSFAQSVGDGDYQYRLVAQNAAGYGGYSSVRSTQVIGPPNTPGTPGVSSKVNLSDSSFTLSWAAGGRVTQYQIERRQAAYGTPYYGGWSRISNTTGRSRTENLSDGRYQYRVRAANEAGVSGWSGVRTVDVLSRASTPGMPGVSAKTNLSDKTFRLSWGASGRVIHYEVERRQAAYGASNYGGWSRISNTTGSSRGESVSDGHFQYRVRAYNEAGHTAWSSVRTVDVLSIPGTPGAPSVSNKVDLSDKRFTLSWTAGGRVTQYHIERRGAAYGTSNYGGWSRISNTTGRSRTENLSDGRYQYRVRAANEAGVSGWSGARTVDALSRASTPGMPGVSAKTNLSDKTFRLSWGASGRVIHYEVERRQAAYGASNYGGWSRISNTTGSSRGESVSDGHFQYRVRAYNEAGHTAWSSVRTVDVLSIPGTPGAPSVSNKVDLSDKRFTLSWTAGGRVTQYHIERRGAAYGTSNYGGWSRISNTTGRSRTENLGGDGRYQYRVRAHNEAGDSAWSNATTVSVLAIPSAPTNISVPNSTGGAFSLRVQYGSGLVDHYRIQDSVNGGQTWGDAETGSGKPSSVTLMRPAYGSDGQLQNRYQFRLSACNDAGCGPYSRATGVIEIRPPGTPSSIAASHLSHAVHDTDSNGQYTLNWSAVPVANVRYSAQESVNGGGWQDVVTDTAQLSHTLTNKPEGTYQYRVRACVTGVGCGDYTHPITVKVRYAPDVPAVPNVLSSHSQPNTTVDGNFTLQWQKPPGRVTRYELYEGGTLQASLSPVLSRAFTNQADGHYRYQIKACNEVVCSGLSAARSVQALHKPILVGGLNGPEASGTGSVELSWRGARHQVSRYEISKNNGAWRSVGNQTLGYSESNLADGDHHYRYRACNELSCSDASATKTVDVYRAPGNVKSVQGGTLSLNGRYTLSWSEATGSVDAYRLEERVYKAGSYGAWNSIATTQQSKMAINKDQRGRYQYRVSACYTPANDCGTASPVRAVLVALPVPAGVSPMNNVNGFTLPASDAAVGATGGSHQVGPDGSANYTIAIPAPAGRGGLTPQLALAYNSNGGNGELGVGWDISGLSRIHRCGKSYALDGTASGIAFDGTDQLCLDGQRLITKSGTYGTNGARYQLLRDPQTEVVSLGAEGSLTAPDASTSDQQGFRVRGADGRTLYFGSSPDSRLELHVKSTSYRLTREGFQTNESVVPVSVNQWMLSRIEDRQGNEIRLVYANNDINGEQRLSEVQYNFNANGSNPLHKLVFNWEDRPDTSQAYFAGAMLTQSKRLQRITAYSSTKALRSLHLDYSNEGITTHSKIAQIQECSGADQVTNKCLKPTTFEWQIGEMDYISKTEHTGLTAKKGQVWPADINGDGYTDLVASDREGYWRFALGGEQGLGDWRKSAYKTTDRKHTYAIIGDYNGDNRDDFLFPDEGRWSVLLGSEDGFSGIRSTRTPETEYKATPRLIDINGDGLLDLLYRGHDYQSYGLRYRLNSGDSFGTEVVISPFISGRNHDYLAKTLVLDVNGDGLQDLLIPNASTYTFYQSTGSGFVDKGSVLSAAHRDSQPQLLDLNGDGLTDILFRGAYGSVLATFNTGSGFSGYLAVHGAAGNGALLVEEKDWEKAFITDANADGQQEFVVYGKSGQTSSRYAIAKVHGAAGYLSIKAQKISDSRFFHDFVVQGDFNGDGALDRIQLTGGARSYTSQLTRPDYLTTVTNGMGATVEFVYQSALRDTQNETYTRGASPHYPLVAEGSDLLVVSDVYQTTGATPGTSEAGSREHISHQYEAYRAHVGGLGGLGFAKRIITNNTTNIRTEMTYSHDYDSFKQGSLARMRTLNGSDQVLSDTQNTWTHVPLGGYASGIAGKRHRLDLSKTTVAKNDWNGAALSYEESEYAYNDWGQPQRMESRVYTSRYSGSPQRTKVTNNTWSNDASDHWVIGLLTRSDVSVSKSGSATQHRRSEFDYSTSHRDRGRKVTERVIDPSTGRTLVETHYGTNANGQPHQDTFNNLLATTVNGPDFAARTDSLVYDSGYGLQPVSSTNALGETTTHTYYGATEMGSGAYPGKLKSTTAPNGLVTRYQYDDFGRASNTTAAHGTAIAVTSYQRYNWCGAYNSYCRSGAVYYTTAFTDGGTPVMRELDVRGREIRTRTLNMAGREVWVDRDFDARGNNVRVTDPYYANASSSRENRVTFDGLDRVVRSNDASGRVDTIEYNGLRRTSTVDVNGKRQTQTEERDALDNVIAITDNDGNRITYDFDALGQQTAVTDSAGNVTTITYNALGHKVAMSDPDKGNWRYTYNGLGKLITQRDAKGQTTCLAYDALGRMVRRVDGYTGSSATELGQNSQAHQQCTGSGTGTSSWSYHTTGSGAGQLNIVTSPGYQQSYRYDAYGRVSETATTIEGQTFSVASQYDRYSRPVTVQYPQVSGAPERLSARTEYNALGYATGTYDASSGALYSRVDAVDVLGNVTVTRSGNGIETTRAFDLDTGYLRRIQARSLYPLADEVIQDLRLSFDAIGNLTSRYDIATGVVEDFVYDDMNRLTDAVSNFGAGDVATSVRYNALGNITYKSGVGHYTYGGSGACHAGPHAVRRIAAQSSGDTKNATYCYDANGNNISGDGRTLAYTTFDKPSTITKGRNLTSMRYGASRELIYRDDTTEQNGQTQRRQTRLVGGLFERVDHVQGEQTGKVELRHYVGGAIVTRSFDVSGNTSRHATEERTRYTHTDHLGSVVAITDELGMVEERHSFDAWGKRRAATRVDLDALLVSDPFNITLSALSLASSITDKGFTGHQQLDGVGIIHMGGRIYDASIGRFLQADPFVQDARNSQSLNRYSYVQNNPLSYTDPSGYFLKWIGKKITRFVKKVFHAIRRAVQGVFKAIGRVLNAVPYLSTVVAAVVCNVNAACWATYAKIMAEINAYVTIANGGSIGDALKGYAVGRISGEIGAAASGALGGALGNAIGETAGNITGAVVVSGVAAKASGGKFIDGVKGAAIGLAIRFAGAWVHTAGEAKAETGGLTDEDRAAADASQAVYDDDSGGELKSLGIKYEPKGGFAASLSVNEEGRYLLAFRGSESGIKNWLANFGQALGFKTSQYEQAVTLGTEVFEKTGGNVTFVGHSLGGGLASAAAMATGGSAITFNAAGLNPFTVRNGSHGGIRAHYIRGDILTSVQRFTPLPNAAGTRISHPGTGTPWARHSMDQF